MKKKDLYLLKPEKGLDVQKEIIEAVREVSETRKKLYFAVFLVVMVFMIGSYAYEAVEGWDLLTSIYFMSATMTTVGYGDVTPKTELGRMMTIVFIWVGISIGFYLIYTISEFREKEVDERLMKFMDKVGAERKKIRL